MPESQVYKLPSNAGWPTSSNVNLHAVALKHFLTSLAELRPILLKALLHRPVIAQLLSAKTRGVPGASLLLLWRTHMAATGKTCRGVG
jgi:hypothetical protein